MDDERLRVLGIDLTNPRDVEEGEDIWASTDLTGALARLREERGLSIEDVSKYAEVPQERNGGDSHG